jgi:hypothetical protein
VKSSNLWKLAPHPPVAHRCSRALRALLQDRAHTATVLLGLALPAAALEHAGFTATYENDTLTLAQKGQRFEAKLDGASGPAVESAVKDATWGPGRALTIPCGAGRVTVSLFEGVPFAFIRGEYANKSDAVTNLRAAPLLSAKVETGTAADSLRALGTAGLTEIDKHSGSFAFLALADPETRRGLVAGWISHDRGDGILFSGRDGAAATLSARVDYGRLLIRPGAVATGEVLAVGFFDDARLGLEQYASQIAKFYAIKLPPQLDGYCTWYSSPHGGASDQDHIVELADFTARELKPFGFDFVQIDDYWQEGKRRNGPAKVFVTNAPAGPYSRGMKPVAEKIGAMGLAPGLWYMPFAGDHEDPWFASRQDWFTKTADGKPYSVKWGGSCLDLTRPEVQAYIADVSRRVAQEWGYSYFKLDGLWVGLSAKLMYVQNAYKEDDLGEPAVFDGSLTPVEAYRKGFRTLREAAGPKTFILGCCVSQNMRSFGSSFGLVDAMRIGPDNGSDMEGLKRGPWHGANRYFLHGRVWYNDPDPLYIRPSIPLAHARLITSWVGLSGMLHTSSDWLPTIPAERLDLLKRVLPNHGLQARPADLFESDLPRIWTLQKGDRTIVGLFNWDDKKAAHIEYPLAKLGLDGAVAYNGFEFWSARPLPPLKDRLVVDLAPGSCRVIALRPAKNVPQVISTSRHITQGLLDVAQETWNGFAPKLTGRSTLVAGDAYELRVAVPAGFEAKAVSCEGAEATLTSGPGLARVRMTSATSRDVNWTIKFAATSAAATGALAKPADLKLVASEPGRVDLAWSNDPAVAGWQVTAGDKAAMTVVEPAFTDVEAAGGAKVTYRVAALGADGRAGEAATIEVEVPKQPTLGPVPPAPTIPLGKLKATKATTGWGKVMADQSAAGRAITIQGEKFSSGIGVHANSTLTYPVKPEYRRFVAVVGLDDEEQKNEGGTIRFTVRGTFDDGTSRDLARSPVLKWNGLRRWHLDVELPPMVKTLDLICDDADDGVRCDHGDWANAGFL